MFEILMFLLVFVLLFTILLSIGASLILLAVIAAIVAGIATVVQHLIAALIQRITGKRPKWMYSPVGFGAGLIVTIAFIVYWYTTPVDPIKVTPEECVVLGWRSDHDEAVTSGIEDPQEIAEILDMIDGLTLKRRLNVRFMNEVMINEFNGHFLYFWDEEGNLIQKIRICTNLVGVSTKEDGEFVYYRTKDEFDGMALNNIVVESNRRHAREAYGDLLDHFPDYWSVTDGVYTFTLPDFPTDSWSVEAYGDVTCVEEGGRVATRKKLTYLELDSKSNELPAGGTISFTPENASHSAMGCTLIIDNGIFFYDLPLPETVPPQEAAPEETP